MNGEMRLGNLREGRWDANLTLNFQLKEESCPKSNCHIASKSAIKSLSTICLWAPGVIISSDCFHFALDCGLQACRKIITICCLFVCILFMNKKTLADSSAEKELVSLGVWLPFSLFMQMKCLFSIEDALNMLSVEFPQSLFCITVNWICCFAG